MAGKGVELGRGSLSSSHLCDQWAPQKPKIPPTTLPTCASNLWFDKAKPAGCFPQMLSPGKQLRKNQSHGYVLVIELLIAGDQSHRQMHKFLMVEFKAWKKLAPYQLKNNAGLAPLKKEKPWCCQWREDEHINKWFELTSIQTWGPDVREGRSKGKLRNVLRTEQIV